MIRDGTECHEDPPNRECSSEYYMQPARVLHLLHSPGRQHKNAVHVAGPRRQESLQAPIALSQVFSRTAVLESPLHCLVGRSAWPAHTHAVLLWPPVIKRRLIVRCHARGHLCDHSLLRGAEPPSTRSPGELPLHAAQKCGPRMRQAQCGAVTVPGTARNRQLYGNSQPCAKCPGAWVAMHDSTTLTCG